MSPIVGQLFFDRLKLEHLPAHNGMVRASWGGMPDFGQKGRNVGVVHGRGSLGSLQKRRGRLLLRDEGIFGCLGVLHGVGSGIDQDTKTCVFLS